MDFSISSSDRPGSPSTGPGRAAWILLASALFLYAGAEGLARFAFFHFSKSGRRNAVERPVALALRPSLQGSRPTLLVLGNSLAIEDLDFPAFARGISSRYDAHRFAVEGTYYYEWYFGTAALFRKGARPNAIALVMNARQFAASWIKGDTSTQVLLDAEDIWALSRARKAGASDTAEWLTAHYSTFYALRQTIRAALMRRFFPAVADMRSKWSGTASPVPPDVDLLPIVSKRLVEMDQLCRMNGAKFILVIPPTLEAGDQAALEAGRRKGVTVIEPLPGSSTRPDWYQDGYLHLGKQGAEVFTKTLIDSMLVPE